MNIDHTGKLEELRTRGWALVRGIDKATTAIEIVRSMASAHHRRSDALIADLPDGAELLGIEGTPTRSPASADAAYEALHFTGGHPLVESEHGQRLATVVAWHCDAAGPRAQLETRLVWVPSILRHAAPGPGDRSVEGRLREYVLAQRDGRIGPLLPMQPSSRLTCLARFLDAMQPHRTLLSEPDRGWFVEPGDTAEASLARENAYFEQRGIHLASHEARVMMEPGDLLVVDNLACAHGYIGPLPHSPRVQLAVGTSALTAGGVRALRVWWATHFAAHAQGRRARPVA